MKFVLPAVGWLMGTASWQMRLYTLLHILETVSILTHRQLIKNVETEMIAERSAEPAFIEHLLMRPKFRLQKTISEHSKEQGRMDVISSRIAVIKKIITSISCKEAYSLSPVGRNKIKQSGMHLDWMVCDFENIFFKAVIIPVFLRSRI